MKEKVLAALADIENVYMDEWGLVGTRHPGGIDGGDSSHKMSHLAIGLYLNNMEMDGAATLALMHRHGLIRHPDKSKWYSDPRTFSRDQFSPRVMAGSLLGIRSAVRQYKAEHKKNWFLRAWNTIPSWNEGTEKKFPDGADWTGPENYGFYIRGLRQYFRYWFLLVADIQTVIDCTIKRFDSDLDINNSLTAAVMACEIMPTGLGHLAWYILKPVVERKLKAYWHKERNEPPIDVILIEGLKSKGYL